MKSEHRHELKTNELAEWLTNLPQWTKQNFKTILYVSVVIVLVVGVYFWNRYQKKVITVQNQLNLTGLIAQAPQTKARIIQAQNKEIDISDILLQNAGRFGEIAQETKNDQMAALALIKQAQLLRTNLHYRFGDVDKIDFTSQINRAKTRYTQAIEKDQANRSLTAMAKFGLGLCEEELGNFDQAKQIYNDIVSDSAFDGTVSKVQAKQRLETIGLFQQKIVFKTSPETTSQSQAQPAPVESTQPQVETPKTDEDG